MPLGATACFEDNSESGDSEPSGEDLGAEDSEDDDETRSNGSTASAESVARRAAAVLPPQNRCQEWLPTGELDDELEPIYEQCDGETDGISQQCFYCQRGY